MFAYMYQNRIITVATQPTWLLYLYEEYPGGTIVDMGGQPITEGAQTL